MTITISFAAVCQLASLLLGLIIASMSIPHVIDDRRPNFVAITMTLVGGFFLAAAFLA